MRFQSIDFYLYSAKITAKGITKHLHNQRMTQQSPLGKQGATVAGKNLALERNLEQGPHVQKVRSHKNPLYDSFDVQV